MFSHVLVVLILERLSMAENYRRRGKFEDVAFIFPNAPSIRITVVRYFVFKYKTLDANSYAPELWHANARLVRHCEATRYLVRSLNTLIRNHVFLHSLNL